MPIALSCAAVRAARTASPFPARLRRAASSRGRCAAPRAGSPPALAASASAAAAAAAAALALATSPPALAYTPALGASEVRLSPGRAAALSSPCQVGDAASTAAGVLFTAASAAFLLRVLRRRASRATNVRLAARRAAAPREELPPPSAGACFAGAAIAAAIACGLWTLSGFLDGLLSEAPPPEQFAARNVAGTLRSIVTGVTYLATFLFAANAVGLSGLGAQTLLQGAAKERTEGGQKGEGEL